MDIWHKHFLPKYGWNIRDKLTNFQGVLSFEDNLFYIVNGDYEGPDIYRNEVSCSRHVHKIQIPTFLYFSLDDPLIGTGVRTQLNLKNAYKTQISFCHILNLADIVVVLNH